MHTIGTQWVFLKECINRQEDTCWVHENDRNYFLKGGVFSVKLKLQHGLSEFIWLVRNGPSPEVLRADKSPWFSIWCLRNSSTTFTEHLQTRKVPPYVFSRREKVLSHRELATLQKVAVGWMHDWVTPKKKGVNSAIEFAPGILGAGGG